MIAARRAALLLAATLLPSVSALAADYDPPVIVEAAEEYVPVEVGSGWYLRGDIGYIVSQDTGRYTYSVSDGVNSGSSSFDSASLDNDFTFGAGVGYSFNEWFRAEATVDGFRSDFSGSTSAAVPCSGDPALAGTGCRSKDGTDMSAISVMANGYVDLGTYVGITPYLGAGLGFSYVSWSDLGSDYFCVDGAAACPSPAFVGSSSMGGESDWRFTYAFMAGAAYDLTKELKVDIGYRYKHIDGGDMFAWSSDGLSIKGKDSDLQQHEIRVGLRYELW
ncbi:porin family protein [Mesorhizobium sp. LHD-90]|uniref:outer membrane protein n=1 Tax=Mesorhizobium sp. LHD-90 TaxID=3071414 RepID=UPI0027DF9F82|nr:porin family protein [Mesorhizobium sp. LHD-90]MDQ6437023.1 porin family protein [Mesorhizobium sp. LHD-90]